MIVILFCWCFDGKVLVVGYDDGSIVIYDVEVWFLVIYV